jgi:hypothetical protein
MMTPKRIPKDIWRLSLFLLACLAAPGLASAAAAFPLVQAQSAQAEQYQELPGPGKKCPIDDNFYFTYEFVQKPQMGTAILRLRVFDKAKTQTAAFKVVGRYDMPSMAGAHDSGDQEFKLNRRQDYLLPVNIVMPGEWEFRLSFRRGEAVIFRGRFRFDV